MSFYEVLTNNPNRVKYDVTFKDAEVDTVNGQTPVNIASIPTNDIVIKGTNPILADSQVNITHAFGQAILQPTNLSEAMTVKSTNGAMTVKSDTGSVFINADTVSGSVNMQSASNQIVCFNMASISANNGVVIQGAGGHQISQNVTDTTITTAGNTPLIFNVGGSMIFRFQNGSTGSYYFPLTDGVAGQSLKTDGNGVLYWG